MSKQRFSATPAEVEPAADSDKMDQCGNKGDGNDEGGNEPNVSQVRQRRCVEPVLEGSTPWSLPTIDSLANRKAVIPVLTSVSSKEPLAGRLRKDSTKKKPISCSRNSLSRNLLALSCRALRDPKGNSYVGGWSLVWWKERRKKKSKHFFSVQFRFPTSC